MIARDYDAVREAQREIAHEERQARAWDQVVHEDIPAFLAEFPRHAPDAMAWVRAGGTPEDFESLASLPPRTLRELFAALMDYDDTTDALREWWCETQYEG